MKTKNFRKSYPALVSFLRYAALSASSSVFYVLLLMHLCFKENVENFSYNLTNF